MFVLVLSYSIATKSPVQEDVGVPSAKIFNKPPLVNPAEDEERPNTYPDVKEFDIISNAVESVTELNVNCVK